MTRISRRRALQLSTGGLAAILATRRAPAFAQGTTIHWVRGSDYVPVSDQLIRTKLNEQAQKDLGLKINLEGVDGLTLQARVTSSVQSATGPDRNANEASSMETSTSCPFPVWVRWNSALETPNAAVAPDSTSHTAKPARVGPVSSWPVSAMMPLKAWIFPS